MKNGHTPSPIPNGMAGTAGWVIDRGATTAFVGAALTMLMLIGASYQTMRTMEGTSGRVAQTSDIRFRGSELFSAVQDVESSARGYVLSGNESYLAPYAFAIDRMTVAMTALRRLTADQPAPQERLRALEPLIAARIDIANQVIDAYRRQGEGAAAHVIRSGRGKAVMDSIRRQLDALDADVERSAVAGRLASDEATSRAFFVLPLAGLFSVAVLSIVFLRLNRTMVAGQQAAEAALHNEEQFRATFEQTAIGLSLASPDGRFLRVNDRLCELLGYRREELEQLKLRDITHPHDLAANKELAQQVLDGKLRSYSLDQRCIHRSGAVVWVNLTASVVRHASAEPKYFIVAIRDVSERRQMAGAVAASEERFRLAASATSDTIWDWNIATGDVWRSVDLPRRFGYHESGAPSEAWWIDHVHPDDRDRVKSEINATFDSSGTLWESEYRFLRADGSAATMHDRAYVVRTDDGAPTRMIGSTSDITEQVEMQAHLQQVQRMETVGQLAGGIAHDFNNLLTVIIGTVDMAAFGQLVSEPIRADLQLIRDTATRAAELTRQLLAFSRRQVLQPAVVNLNDVVSGTLPMLHRLIGEHVTLLVRPAEALGSAFVDATQVQQVLLNLAINGRDAMPHGGTLTIATENAVLDEAYTRTHEGARAGPNVVLSVSDDGTGMDAATRHRIFEPFFTTKEPGKGTGLGLATVYGIVKQSNGYIWVDSKPGHGTTFRVHFPLTASPASDPAPAVLSHARSGTHETILVVEDQEGLRSLCAQMLELLDYTVLTAASGADALDLLERHPGTVDLVLTDMVMPGMSGPALVERLRSSHPGVKILVTSGYVTGAAGLNSALDAGAFFIGKPYSLNDLSHKLKEVLDS